MFRKAPEGTASSRRGAWLRAPAYVLALVPPIPLQLWLFASFDDAWVNLWANREMFGSSFPGRSAPMLARRVPRACSLGRRGSAPPALLIWAERAGHILPRRAAPLLVVAAILLSLGAASGSIAAAVRLFSNNDMGPYLRAFRERVSWGPWRPSVDGATPIAIHSSRSAPGCGGRSLTLVQDCSPRRRGGSAAARGRGTRPKTGSHEPFKSLGGCGSPKRLVGSARVSEAPPGATSPKDPDQTRPLRFFNWPRFVTGELIRRWTLSANRRHAIRSTTGGVDVSIGYKPASVVSGFILCWSCNRTIDFGSSRCGRGVFFV